jgi:hypothetical protein
MIGEMKARHHDRWNRKTILVSQGWDAGHELDDCWQESEQLVWGFECPECGQWQKYDFNSIIYDEAKTEDGFDWEKVGNSTRYRCSGCGVEWPDTSMARREIASRASYRSEGNPHKSGCLAFTFPAYAVWWIPWRDLVAEWLAANSEKHRGNLEPLRQFIMKRKAEPWKEDVTSDIGEMVGSGYLLADHAGGDTWDGELHRFMTVDKQRDHFWCVIRSWKPDASSRLMWAGRVLTWDILQELAGVFKVKPPLVCVDAGFETNQVYEECSKRGWTAVHGSGRKDFPHIVNGKTANRPTSKIEWATASNMQRCRYFHFSAEATKDKLSLLRAGQAQAWEVPDDMPPDYVEQMDSETKRDIVNAKTKQIERRWVKISGSRPNHLFDCESMQVAAAFVMKLFAPHITAPSSTNSEES